MFATQTVAVLTSRRRETEMKTLRKCEGPWLWVAIAILTAMPAWADGEFDTTFGTNGVVKIPFSNVSSATLGAVAIVNGLIESAGFEAEYWTGSGCSSRFPNLLIVTLSPTGALVGNPLSVPQQSIGCPTDLVIDPATGSIFAKGIQVTSSSDGLVVRFDATGAPTASYSLAQNSCG